jgi:hemolysin activation/secretion protein
VTLGRPQRVLALRAYLSKDDPAPGARVPFYLMAYLGGSHTLRAFDSQRFRGEKLALLQAEYRWEASPSIELALFLDRGAVAATTDDPLDEFRTDGGIGLRFKTHERTIVRFDVAWGGEGTRLAFRFNPSF